MESTANDQRLEHGTYTAHSQHEQRGAEGDVELEQRQQEDKQQQQQQQPGQKHEQVELKKQIGLVSGIAVLVGGIIGSGIFISPKGVMEGAGSVGLALILWVVGGVVSLMGVLSYAELGLLFPQSGGEYVYFQQTIGSLPAFLWVWTFAFLIRAASSAVIMLTCARYLLVLFYTDGCGSPPETHIQMLATALILLIISVNIFSVRLAANVQVVFMVAKLVALAIIIIGGFVKLAQGYTTNFQNAFEGTNSNIGEIVTGLYSAMFAYDGWHNLNIIVEELIRPEKNILRSMLIGVPLVMTVYVLANVSYFTVMSPEELLASPAVAVTWAEYVIPGAVWIIPLAVAMSTFGSCNGGMLVSGRYFFAAARGGHMMEILSMLHVRRYTPLPALVVMGVLAIVCVYLAGVQTLINFVQFSIWFFYGLAMVCIFVLRVRMKDAKRIFKVPLICPIIVLVFAFIMVVLPIIFDPAMEYLYAVILILFGLVFYFPFVYFKLVLPGMGRMTSTLQVFLQLAPTKHD